VISAAGAADVSSWAICCVHAGRSFPGKWHVRFLLFL